MGLALLLCGPPAARQQVTPASVPKQPFQTEKAEGPPCRVAVVGVEGGPRQWRLVGKLVRRNVADVMEVSALPPGSCGHRAQSLRVWEYSRGFSVSIKRDGGILQVLNKGPASKKSLSFSLELKIPFVDEGIEPQRREMTCSLSHRWSKVERAGTWVLPLLTQLSDLFTPAQNRACVARSPGNPQA